MHIPRACNILVDALANLSSTFNFPINEDTETIIIQKMEEPSIYYHDPLLRELKELEERRQSIADQRESVEVVISEVQEEIEDENHGFRI